MDLTPVQRRLAFAISVILSTLGIAFHLRQQRGEEYLHQRALHARSDNRLPSASCGRCQHRTATSHTCGARDADDGIILVCDDCLGAERNRGDFTRHLRWCGREHVERYATPLMVFNMMYARPLEECRFCHEWKSPWATALAAHEALCERARLLRSRLAFPYLPAIDQWRSEYDDLIPPTTLRARIIEAESDVRYLRREVPTSALLRWQQEEDGRREHERRLARDAYHQRSRANREAALRAQGVDIDPLDVPLRRQGRCGKKRKLNIAESEEGPQQRRRRSGSADRVTPSARPTAAIEQPPLPMSAYPGRPRLTGNTGNPIAAERDITRQDDRIQVTVQCPTAATSATRPTTAVFTDEWVESAYSAQAYDRRTGRRVASALVWGHLRAGVGSAMFTDGGFTGARAASVLYERGIAVAPPPDEFTSDAIWEVHLSRHGDTTRQVGTLWVDVGLPLPITIAVTIDGEMALLRFCPITSAASADQRS